MKKGIILFVLMFLIVVVLIVCGDNKLVGKEKVEMCIYIMVNGKKVEILVYLKCIVVLEYLGNIVLFGMKFVGVRVK